MEIKTTNKVVALNPSELKARLEKLEGRISSLRRCL